MRTILMYVMLMCCSATIAQTAVVADLAAKVEETSQEMYVEDPVLQDPVSLNAALVWSNDKKQLAVVMKVRVLEGWHIYAYVPDSQPYLTAELKLSAPDGVTPIGE
ncbi:hypothetical protein SAMN02927921_00470 [Sinomicrobium oceani]|uniref:Uncharacterized protein n=1 Tax=Sinomicrobium oceani TaxID=1150368 RepID=A0A1K1M8C1_9FLAO|nr:hypothetical protein [Sinomicrobium oceani]SFW19376.1 hypothetical protein SAMN02927921_00470 [Sinomicrobium oceani]